MIFNIRGTNGSGKGWAVQRWLQRYAAQPIFGVLGMKAPEAYQLAVPQLDTAVFVLGPYDRVSGGGCDELPPAVVLSLLRKYADRGHVIFEGVLMSHVYGKVGAIMDELAAAGPPAYVIFLTTPLERCIANVEARRAARGETKPLDTYNLTSQYQRAARLRRESWPPQSRVQLLDLAASEVHNAILWKMRVAEKGERLGPRRVRARTRSYQAP